VPVHSHRKDAGTTYFGNIRVICERSDNSEQQERNECAYGNSPAHSLRRTEPGRKSAAECTPIDVSSINLVFQL
jgi:hypothetical protein